MMTKITKETELVIERTSDYHPVVLQDCSVADWRSQADDSASFTLILQLAIKYPDRYGVAREKLIRSCAVRCAGDQQTVKRRQPRYSCSQQL
jgi:hypothetical protein